MFVPVATIAVLVGTLLNEVVTELLVIPSKTSSKSHNDGKE